MVHCNAIKQMDRVRRVIRHLSKPSEDWYSLDGFFHGF